MDSIKPQVCQFNLFRALYYNRNLSIDSIPESNFTIEKENNRLKGQTTEKGN